MHTKSPQNLSRQVTNSTVAVDHHEICPATDGDQPSASAPVPRADGSERASAVELPIHEIALIFPSLWFAEFEALKVDIRKNGQRDPILLHEGQIVDGVDRLRACRELGLAPRFEEWDGEGSLVELVLSRNLHRHYLTESQRAMVAAKLEPHFAADAKGNKRRRGQGQANLPDLRARKHVAKLTRVSPRLVTEAAQVLKEIPEWIEAVESGQIRVSVAAAMADMKKTDKAKLAADKLRADRARAAELRRAGGPANVGA